MSDDHKVFFPTLPAMDSVEKEHPEHPEASKQIEQQAEQMKQSLDDSNSVHFPQTNLPNIVRLDPAPHLQLSHQQGKENQKERGKEEKDDSALRTIGEAADLLDMPVHVIRFWQARFGELRPIKRADGRCYYRKRDIALLFGLRRLLHEEGYTIKGVRRLIRKEGIDFVRDKAETAIADHDDRLSQILYGLVADLQHIQKHIHQLVA